jgi:hypothetical protein
MDNQSYLPPNVEREINNHVQANLPGYIKRYTGSDTPSHMTPSLEAAISNEVQSNLPDHLKAYAGAYVNQQVTQPTMQNNASQMSGQRAVPPRPDLQRRDHNLGFGEQHTAEISGLPVAAQTRFEDSSGRPTVPQVLTQTPNQPQNQQNPVQHPAYDFILNPEQPAQTGKPVKTPGLPGGSSILVRSLTFGGGLILLIIIGVVIKSVLSSSGNFPMLLSVVQDQQELIHISNEASAEPDISSTNQTFASTINLVFSDSASNLSSYLSSTKHKISTKEAELKQNPTIDTDIRSAESAGDFNQYYNQVASAQMNQYLADLKTAYRATKTSEGRALLSSDYNQAILLDKVLDGKANGDSST